MEASPCERPEPAFLRFAGFHRWSSGVPEGASRVLPHYDNLRMLVRSLELISQLGLSSAPTIQFHPAQSGPNKSNKLSVISYDLNRKCALRRPTAAPADDQWNPA